MLRAIPATDPELAAALAAEGLPTADLGRGAQRFFAFVDGEGRVLGHGGLEGEGADRLLRSVVVAPAARRAGVARRLVAALEVAARADGAERLWLLTTSAATVFDRLGWRRVARTDAPAVVTGSAQFASLCPASAVCMARDLDR